MRFLPALPRRQAPDPAVKAAKAQERAAEEGRRRSERDAQEAARAAARATREASRTQARAAREEAATRWARRALDVPTVAWMEGILWFCTVAALGVAYALSYSHQSGVFEELDYGGWEHLTVPLALDLPLTASVAALYLSARWKSPRLQRWVYRGTTLLTAPLSLGANALHGSVHAGRVDWVRVTEPVHLASSLIPAVIVLVCVIVAEVTFGEKARLDELASRRGPLTTPAEQAPVPEAPVGQTPPLEDPVGPPGDPGKAPPASRRRAAKPKKAKAAGRNSRPSQDEVIATIEALARERSIPVAEVPNADVASVLDPEGERSAITVRTWIREARRAMGSADNQTPLAVLRNEEGA